MRGGNATSVLCCPLLINSTVVISGKSMTECFLLVRPLIHFSFDEVMTRTNNVFVFEVLAQPEKKGRLEDFKLTSHDEVSHTRDV